MKSVITCNLEGTIFTMNSCPEQIFGYNKDELIGKKRVSLFSPGEIVLQNVDHWLDVASKNGKYNGKTVFLNKFGDKFNDYFDNIDGTDDGNSDYLQQFSGVSRAVELGLISIEKTKTFAVILLLLTLSFGVYNIFNAHPENVLPIFLIASIGLFLGYYYTCPPLRLLSRGGLGELAIFLAFGSLLVLGAAFAVTSYSLLASEHFFNMILIGTPIGLLTTNILLINEFPDRESDMSTGKNHIVGVLGKKNSRYVYLFILSLVAIITFYLAFEVTSFLFIPLILVVFYGFKICLHLFKYFDSRALVTANWGSIKLQVGYCILMIFSFILNAII